MNVRQAAPSAIAGDPAVLSAALLEPGIRPVLDDAQLNVLRDYGTEHDFVTGDVLYEVGDDHADLIVVLDGEVQAVENRGQPDERVIIAFGPHEFLGEMRLLTGQPAVLSAVASRSGRMLRISVEQVQDVMSQESGLSELLLHTFLLRHSALTHLGSGLTLIGSRFDANTRRLLEVLARNRLASRWLDLERSPEGEALLRRFAVPLKDPPVIIVPGRPLLRNPSSHALLGALGMSARSEYDPSSARDLLVVGGGPGGLAAAVYGASEGMTTTLAEDTALGGQAGTTTRIENYLGFPAGLSGEELAARGVLQAQKFGAQIWLAARAVSLESDGGLHRVTFDDASVITAKSLIIATGARYNRLPIDRIGDFEGAGVYYAATQMEAEACARAPVAIVGGGNSAGQAALFLARNCTRVHIIVRGEGLGISMSRYLIAEIEQNPRITVTPHTQVTALVGDQQLQGVKLQGSSTQGVSTLAVSGLFVFIGAKPSIDWLDGQLAEDSHGFLLTGPDIPVAQREDRDFVPLFLETSRPGIFCIGDVRSGSIKRIATSIGEGSMAVRLVFERLQRPVLPATQGIQV
jgi:thioredoxin reductase (NADPH)